MINKYCKSAVIQIATDCKPYFSEPVFPEIHQLGGSSFFAKCLKCNIDFKNAKKKKKIVKKFFVFQITASELVPLNCLY